MGEYDTLIQAVAASGEDMFWLGPAETAQIERLQKLLDVKLPTAFQEFLRSYGGGGVVGCEISGIENNDATIARGGSVLWGTEQCRQRFGLPRHLVVIYFHEDEICWCLDTSRVHDDECPVVSYDVFKQRVDRCLSSSFREFFIQYLRLRTN